MTSGQLTGVNQSMHVNQSGYGFAFCAFCAFCDHSKNKIAAFCGTGKGEKTMTVKYIPAEIEYKGIKATNNHSYDIRTKVLKACYTSDLYKLLPINKKTAVYDSVKNMFLRNDDRFYYMCFFTLPWSDYAMFDADSVYDNWTDENGIPETEEEKNDFCWFLNSCDDPWEDPRRVQCFGDWLRYKLALD